VDGQPFLEDLSRSEVRHYKDEAAAWLAYRERRGDIERDHVVGFKPRWRNDCQWCASSAQKLTAFMELESAIRATVRRTQFLTKPVLATQFAPQASQAEESEA
jgi:hypothetical protein